MVRVALFSAALFTACGGDPPDPCVDEPVTFTAEIGPLVVQPYCVECHASALVGAARNGAPPDLSFDGWAEAMPHAASIANAVTSGRMPPAGRPRPTMEERALVEAWRRCGFQE